MSFSNIFKLNFDVENMQRMLIPMKSPLILFKISLNKKLNYEGLDLETLLKHFDDHIKVSQIKDFYKSFAPAPFDVCTQVLKNPQNFIFNYQTDYIFYMCQSLCADLLNKTDWLARWKYQNDKAIIMEILFTNPNLFASNNEYSAYFFKQSLVELILNNVKSEEAEIYFKNNLDVSATKTTYATFLTLCTNQKILFLEERYKKVCEECSGNGCVLIENLKKNIIN